jgi:hypothetical protein
VHHHHHTDYVQVVASQGPSKLSGKWTGIFGLMTLVGFATFAYAAFVSDQPRVGWIAYLHNFYFFTGLSSALVVTAAIMQAARSHWGRTVKRFAEAGVGFLPAALLLCLPFYFGVEHIYEWAYERPDPHYYTNKHWYLTPNFWLIRIIIAVALVWFVAHKFCQTSFRPDLGVASEENSSAWTAPAGWAGRDAEVAKSYEKQSFWAVIYCIIFPVGISALAYDMIMSLDYRWFSAMFGGWNFTTFILTGWGSLILLTWLITSTFGLDKYVNKVVYHDLGKLTFGFTIVWGYLFFAQYQVIWYGNLPHETGYLLTRFYDEPWRAFSLTVFAMVFLIPFIIGLSKDIKMSPKTFAPIVLISLVGVWLERFVLIAPSTWYYDRVQHLFEPGVTNLLIMDILVFIGFFGLFGLLYSRTLLSKPLMVISDPRLDQGVNRH